MNKGRKCLTSSKSKDRNKLVSLYIAQKSITRRITSKQVKTRKSTQQQKMAKLKSHLSHKPETIWTPNPGNLVQDRSQKKVEIFFLIEENTRPDKIRSTKFNKSKMIKIERQIIIKGKSQQNKPNYHWLYLHRNHSHNLFKSRPLNPHKSRPNNSKPNLTPNNPNQSNPKTNHKPNPPNNSHPNSLQNPFPASSSKEWNKNYKPLSNELSPTFSNHSFIHLSEFVKSFF